ncbi:hypothetical protein [Hymenobacter terrenus]|uniref:hypothetical protein n=1 Tax=Hymenobacter terrenus TaxID=1629124 RepID=UPI000619C87E|nr:hypothetical protein [Hymenobacter terrenus]
MPSGAIAPAAPPVGAAGGQVTAKWVALRAALAKLAAKQPPRPVLVPTPAPIGPAAVVARHALARAHAAFFDACAAKWALRDNYRTQPGRFAQLRAAILRCREAQFTYQAAAAAFHASPAGAALQAARAKYPRF